MSTDLILPVPQTGVLPIHYVRHLEQASGIEPEYSKRQPEILPLNYACPIIFFYYIKSTCLNFSQYCQVKYTPAIIATKKRGGKPQQGSSRPTEKLIIKAPIR